MKLSSHLKGMLRLIVLQSLISMHVLYNKEIEGLGFDTD